MISIIIIEYFSVERTLIFINDLIKASDIKNLSFIVVDNSDSDENYEKLFMGISNNGFILEDINMLSNCIVELSKSTKRIDCFRNGSIRIFICRNKKNYGFAKGNNIGFKIARYTLNTKYVIFSNNDIKFYRNYLNLSDLLVQFDADKQIALVGPKVIGLDGKDQSPYIKKNLYDRWWKKQLIWPFSKILGAKIKNIDSDLIEGANNSFVYRIIGAFMIFDSDKFEEIGMFDENTFLYAEEMIIAEKLKKFNYKTYYYKNQTLIHEQGYCTNRYGNIKNLIIKRKRMFESELYYYKQYIKITTLEEYITKIIMSIYIVKLHLCKILYDAYIGIHSEK